MSLRKQAKILGTSHANLSRMINGKRKWNTQLKERYESLIGTTLVPLQENSGTTNVKYTVEEPHLCVAHSSSGLGHCPLKAEITGSNPVCATITGQY